MIDENVEGKLKKIDELLDRSTFEYIVAENITLEKTIDNLISNINYLMLIKPR